MERFLNMQKSRTAAMLIVAAMAATTFTALAEDRAAIPSQFHGIWGAGTNSCLAREWRNRDTLHRISSGKTEWWEASCNVEFAAPSRGDPETLELTLICQGEGEDWTSRELWKSMDLGKAKFLISAIPALDRIQLYRLCD